MPDSLSLTEWAINIQNSPSSNTTARYNATAYLNNQISAEEFLATMIYQIGLSATRAWKFEELYPKQTQQLIKIGQDLTYFGQKDTFRTEEINDLKAYYNQKFQQVSGQLVDLGKAQTNLSTTIQGSIDDIYKQLGNVGGGAGLSGFLGGLGTGGLIVVGLLIFMMVRHK